MPRYLTVCDHITGNDVLDIDQTVAAVDSHGRCLGRLQPQINQMPVENFAPFGFTHFTDAELLGQSDSPTLIFDLIEEFH